MLALLNILQTAEQAHDHMSMLEPGSAQPIEAEQKDASMQRKLQTLMAAQNPQEVREVYADSVAVQHLAMQRLKEFEDEPQEDGVQNLEHTLENEKHLAEHAHVAQDTLG